MRPSPPDVIVFLDGDHSDLPSELPLLLTPMNRGAELVIGQDSRGYVALYRYVSAIDTVFVLAIRSQRELGYKHGR